MSGAGLFSLVLALLVVAALALLARPRRASAVDFYLAGQRIGIVTNACAICGDYFSAASFLGVAAAVYASGLDGVWYATGFAAGFVPVVLFVAAPLRRFGQFSIPDFLARRLGSDGVRVVAVGVVQLVILSYLVPQAVGSGITWQLFVGSALPGLSPYATGVVVSTGAVALLVVLGGMRGATWTQAVQFLFLLAVLCWLAALVVGAGFRYADALGDLGAAPLANPVLEADGWQLRPEANGLAPERPARFDRPGARYGPWSQFALVITLVLGTAGLPHVMNRYFTSPTGRAARFTTVWVLGAAGIFYALAVLLGTAARATIDDAVARAPWIAALTVEGVLRVPEHALLVLGRLHAGAPGLTLIAIAALIAVLSTMAGLLLAAAASWGYDVYQRLWNPGASQRRAVLAGRLAVVVTATFSGLLAVALQPESLSSIFPSIVATMVTWAFALAGSSLTPVVIMSIWWRGVTARGAAAGMATGAAVAIGMFVTGILLGAETGVLPVLLTPTPVAGPLAALVTAFVSRRTTPPDDLDGVWTRLHGTAADRHAERLARLTIAGVTRPERHGADA